MSGARKTGKHSAESIAVEIKTELRNILHNLCELLRPLNHFYTSQQRPVNVPRHFVCFDRSVHREVMGLRHRTFRLRLPIESLADRTALTAAAVWHLKDRLNHYAKATGSKADTTAWANGNVNTRMCGDIGNHKKHGHNQNVSGRSPKLAGTVELDTSGSGLIELYYHSSTKQRELLVSDPTPIPFRIDIVDPADAVTGNSTDIIRAGFDHWLPLIDQLGILSGGGGDDEALREVLFPTRSDESLSSQRGE